jgi:RNA polymerase sigma factor (sigma-70 family)
VNHAPPSWCSEDVNDESAVPMEELLAHRQWVRALAQRLAADESSADDLEQETWLAAVQHPPRDARSPRGWLGTVLRNVQRNAARGATRRGRREEAAARRETSETADDLVAEAETQAVLVREVLALDEPYRSTVLLRWFDDLTPDEVARRQGVPLETVRTRLKRAVARLRERMDERHGGDRRAWCLLLLGREGPGTGTGAGTTAAALAAGGVAMGLATKLTIAAAVLVAAGAFWWSRSDDAAPAAPPGRTETAAAPAAPPVPAKRDHRAGAPSESAAPAPAALDLTKADRDLDLHGVVALADGSPVAGAKVQAVDYPWRRTMTMDIAALFEERLGASTATSAEGAFALRLRRGEARLLRASAEGLATREVGPFQAGERVTITMTPAVTLRVTVKDQTGAPVAGGVLWLMGFGRGGEPWVNRRATTDAAGRCAFDGLPGSVSAAVIPVAGVGDFGTQRIALPVSGETTLDLVSPAGRTLRGRVFDAVTLAPIADATVGLGKAWVLATKTDGGGRFEIRGFTGKGEQSIGVSAAGYAQAMVRVGADDSIEFALRRGFSAAGRVVDAGGRPVEGACVAVEAARVEAGIQRSSSGHAASGADGRFRVSDLDRTMPHVVTAHVAGSGRIRRPVAPPQADADAVDLGELRLSEPRAIEGRVLKPDGSPWPGANVRLTGPSVGDLGSMQEVGAQEERRSDDLGRFRFPDLCPGVYSVEMQVPGESGPAARVTLPADRDVLDVVLSPKSAGGDIVVVVKDDAGAPVAGLNVSGSGDMRGAIVSHTDADGRAVLRSPQEGRITRIDVGERMPTQPFLRVPTIRVEPGRDEYAVTIERGAFVACRLLDPDGAPIARATIAVEPGERVTNFSMTDADGRLRVALPRQGEFALVFQGGVYVGDQGLPSDSLLEARVDGVTAQAGVVELRCRRVETGQTATVRVLSADGAPVTDAEVRIYAWANVERKAKTDAEGRARFDDLPAHEFLASASYRPGLLAPKFERFVPSGQEVVLRYPSAVTISGTAFLPGGAPAANASVTVWRGETAVCMSTADASGRFSVQVPAGDDGPFRLDAGARVDKTFVSASRPLTPQDRGVRVDLTKP